LGLLDIGLGRVGSRNLDLCTSSPPPQKKVKKAKEAPKCTLFAGVPAWKMDVKTVFVCFNDHAQFWRGGGAPPFKRLLPCGPERSAKWFYCKNSS